jgi:hypothetical protein
MEAQMRVTLRFWLLLLLFTVGATACSAASLVSVQISAPKNIVKLGENIVIEVRATNTSQTPVIVGNPPMYMEVYVENANGNSVPRIASARISASSGLIDAVLNPGEAQESETVINHFFNIKTAGTYLIRVKYGYSLLPPLSSVPISNPAALSNLIRVTVTQ